MKGDYLYAANYTSGLRVLDISEREAPQEAAFFDTYPSNNNVSFAGAWTAYPFFEDGPISITSSGSDAGLYLVRVPALSVDAPEVPTLGTGALRLGAPAPNPLSDATRLELTLGQPQHVRAVAYDLLGREAEVLRDGALAAGTAALIFEAEGLPASIYIVRVETEGGQTATRTVTLLR